MNPRTYEATPAKRVAFLGLGVMGYPMAGPPGARRSPGHGVQPDSGKISGLVRKSTQGLRGQKGTRQPCAHTLPGGA